MEEKKKKKALLIRLSSLGDVILNIPLANVLKDAGYEVTWIVSEKGIQVIENNPCVDHVILAPVGKWKKNGWKWEHFVEYFNIIKKLRKEKFDVAIDSQMLIKSMICMIFSGAKKRISSLEGREFSYLAANTIIPKISFEHAPIIENYLRYVKPIGLNPKLEDIKVTLPERTPEQKGKIDEILSNLDSKKPLVIIAPATTWNNKHWNKLYWKEVVNNLGNKCNIIFTGGKVDNDLIEFISEGKFINLAGKTNLMELMELFSRANLVISPDSGSTHLAWAARKPAVITIFTCTPKDVLAPYGDKNKYIALGGQGLACQPCFKRKCKYVQGNEKELCTFNPTPQEVLQAIENLIFK